MLHQGQMNSKDSLYLSVYSKEELEQWTEQFHSMVMKKRQIRKNQEKYITRPSAGLKCDLPKIVEETISNADSNNNRLDSVTVQGSARGVLNIFKSNDQQCT